MISTQKSRPHLEELRLSIVPVRPVIVVILVKEEVLGSQETSVRPGDTPPTPDLLVHHGHSHPLGVATDGETEEADLYCWNDELKHEETEVPPHSYEVLH